MFDKEECRQQEMHFFQKLFSFHISETRTEVELRHQEVHDKMLRFLHKVALKQSLKCLPSCSFKLCELNYSIYISMDTDSTLSLQQLLPEQLNVACDTQNETKISLLNCHFTCQRCLITLPCLGGSHDSAVRQNVGLENCNQSSKEVVSTDARTQTGPQHSVLISHFKTLQTSTLINTQHLSGGLMSQVGLTSRWCTAIFG